MVKPALELKEFDFTYPDRDRSSLRDLSLLVGRGEFVVVCGRSGSGKSTLLRAACGLVPHHFGGRVSGEARVCGLDLRGESAGSLAAVCGTVLQDPEVQVVMGSVRHEIGFPLENAGWKQNAIDIAVEETATALGIQHLLDRRTAELSGGELQRVVLAAAIAPRPELIVLDEPTSQLDPVAADELFSTLRSLNGSFGTTILVADHRIERCLEFADRVLVLEHGELVCDTVPELFLNWAGRLTDFQWLLPPVARMFWLAGFDHLPTGIKLARGQLSTWAKHGSPPRIIDYDPQPGAPIARPPMLVSRRDRGARNQSAAPVITVKKLTHTYGRRERPAIDAVDFSIAAGERVVLMGANGSGKSTLLRLLRGLEQPRSGKVERTGEIGLMLQNPNNYLIHERVADEVPAGVIERFGLTDLAERDPRDLSGGERQRLALAIVMQDDPVVLLLDEPSRGMDRCHKQELSATLARLAITGTALVVATHDTEFAAAFADRVLLLGGGRVLADDSPEAILGGGWHFASDIAKLLPGRGALTPEQGAFSLIGRSLPAVSITAETNATGLPLLGSRITIERGYVL